MNLDVQFLNETLPLPPPTPPPLQQTMEQQPHRACERTKSKQKQKQNQVTSHLNIIYQRLAQRDVSSWRKFNFL